MSERRKAAQFKPGNDAGKDTRFKPGQSGNPGGQAKGTRRMLNAAFLKALSKDFDKHGEEAIKNAREDDPVGYVKVIASLLPKQVEETKPLEDVSDAELAAAIALLRSQLAANAGEGAGATIQ